MFPGANTHELKTPRIDLSEGCFLKKMTEKGDTIQIAEEP